MISYTLLTNYFCTPWSIIWDSLMAQWVKDLPAMQETQETLVWSLGWDDPLEEEMATHSSILAWKIPWTEGLTGIGQRVTEELDVTKHTHFVNLHNKYWWSAGFVSGTVELLSRATFWLSSIKYIINKNETLWLYFYKHIQSLLLNFKFASFQFFFFLLPSKFKRN